MNNMKTETTYHLPDAAAILSVHPRTLTRWYHAGKIRLIVLPGRHFRVPGSEIARLLAEPMQSELEAETPPEA
jgi:excisionase family DNA binding protein